MAKATKKANGKGKASKAPAKKTGGRYRSPGKLDGTELKAVLKARKSGKSYMEIAEQFRLAPAGNPEGDRATYGRIAVRRALRELTGAKGEARAEAAKLTKQVFK